MEAVAELEVVHLRLAVREPSVHFFHISFRVLDIRLRRFGGVERDHQPEKRPLVTVEMPRRVNPRVSFRRSLAISHSSFAKRVRRLLYTVGHVVTPSAP